MLVITFKAVNGVGSKYIRDLIEIKNSKCNFHSSTSSLLIGHLLFSYLVYLIDSNAAVHFVDSLTTVIIDKHSKGVLKSVGLISVC